MGGKAPADGAVKMCLTVNRFLNWIDMIQVGRGWRSLGILVLCGFCLAFFLVFVFILLMDNGSERKKAGELFE